MDLYLIRHAETVGNTGADDSAEPTLTPKGHEQARLLADRLAQIRFDAVYCSPLLRAVQTAHAVLSRQADAPPVILAAELMEHQPIPGYSGLPTEQLAALCPGAVYPDRHALPAETQTQALQRAQVILRRVRSAYPEGSVLIVAHGQFNTYLLLAALGLPKPEGMTISQRNACVNRIEYFPDGRVKAKLINDVAHLPAPLWT